ncbi:MAG: tetratricopeptide repeat protein [Chloroflexi bacterium]|nr:tetratricopeptide repeat protein [Chloroflexota bacterium]
MRPLIPHTILKAYADGQTGGHLRGAVLFVDIAGFTRLTESLMKHAKDGAEILTDAINRIFDPIVDQVYAQGGFISTFAGDAFTAIFPDERPDPELRACEVAWRIIEFLAEHPRVETKYGAFDIAARVGVADGDVEWGIWGEEGMHTYYFRGAAIDAVARAEHLAAPGEIVFTEGIANALGSLAATEVTDGHWRLLSLHRHPAPMAESPPPPARRALRAFLDDHVVHFTAEAEFRQVCNVFISLDANAQDEALAQFVGKAVRLAKDYGGYFNKLDFGDKGGVALILFGAPVSHEDDIQRAADMLLALREESVDLRWRAGLTFGIVYAGIVGGSARCEYTAIGDVVNLSARLMMAAPWGDIWVSSDAQALLATTHQLEPMGEFMFKGKTEPVAVHRLVRKRDAINRALFTGQFVGREAELSRLHRFVRPLFERPSDNAPISPGLMVIFGEAGMGKSRLVYEFRRQLEEAREVRWAYCPAEGILRQSLNPFVYFLRDYFDQSSEKSADENRQSFENVLSALCAGLPEDHVESEELRRELQRTRSMLAALLDLHWPDSLYERLEPRLRFENTLTAIIDLFKAESLVQPVIIELDDAHVLDADSRTLLAQLLRETRDYPVAVLVCSRYRDDGGRYDFRFHEDAPYHEIELTYFQREGVRTFAEDILGAELSQAAIDFLHERTNGNPFFIEQLVLELQDRDWLIPDTEEEGRLTIPPLENIEVPTGINALLIARLDRLMAEVKEAVQTAAVLGREFEVMVLERMLAGQGADLEKSISAAEAHGIWLALSEIRYIFRHAMMRDSAYEMQLRTRLRELHGLAARAIEVVYADDLPSHYVDLAYHYEEAEMDWQARHYLRLAADHSRDNYQNELALSLYERLLKYTPETDWERVEVHESRGDILATTGEHDRALAEYDTALEVMRHVRNGERTATRTAALFRKIGWAYLNKGEYEMALEQLARARRAEGGRQTEETARIHIATAAVLYRQGKANAALASCEKGLAAARAFKDRADLAHGYMLRGTIHTGLGQFDEAIEDYQVSLALSQDLGDLVQQSKADNSLGAVYYYKGDWERAVYHYRRSLEIAEQIGFVDQQATVSNNLGEVHLIRGDFDEAEKRFLHSLATWRRTGFLLGVAISHRNLAQIAVYRRDWEGALDYLQQSLDTLAELGSRDWLTADVYRLAAEAYLGLGWWDKAREQCNRSLEIAHSQDLKLVEGNSLRVLGKLHLAEGDLSAAEIALQGSLERAVELGMRHEQGQTLLELARLYQARWRAFDSDDDRRQAIEVLEQTIALFEEIDAQWDLEQAQALQAQLACTREAARVKSNHTWARSW